MSTEIKNLCAEIGCSACCKDITLEYLSDKDRVTLTPPGTTIIPVVDIESLPIQARDARISSTGTVILFHRREDRVNFVEIVGACPNLLTDGSCGVYDNRPWACRNFKFEGDKCMSMREQPKTGKKVFLGDIQKRPDINN